MISDYPHLMLISGKLRDFFIVPMDDVITLSDLVGEKKRNFNENESSSAYNMSIGQVVKIQ